MTPKHKKSSLKRNRISLDEETDTKKPRRSERIQSLTDSHPPNRGKKDVQLPSPLTHRDSTATEKAGERGTSSNSPSLAPVQRHNPLPSPAPASIPAPAGLSSPPSDTQAFSQFVYPPKSKTVSHEVEDEVAEGVWGYLVPVTHMMDVLVLRERNACAAMNTLMKKLPDKPIGKDEVKKSEESFEVKKIHGTPAGGYLIGRHPECDRIVEGPTVSNRHCLLFSENKGGGVVAVVEDLSANGTFVNEAFVGRNKRRELKEGDEIAIVEAARFVFRYPSQRGTHGFKQKYSMQEQLGKGHFATVYLCVERNTGIRYAVKKFEKRTGPSERSKMEGLQQEIAVLMGVSHPSLLCLKETFDEFDGVYLVLELAPEGELFNLVIMKGKLSENECRTIYLQLFQAIKYLHERNIVHRDIKPENILLTDRKLTVKLADFGLAKIIGEESFTTTLCGTPSYVAPEILENSSYRRYTRAVDVWSLGVVLYICLCGFPPFSDELYSAENPYTLSQQIKMGRFDYPSPYWDSVADPALDLIDRMLTVDSEKRITIDECLEHPWMTQREMTLTDSTDGLTGAMDQLDFTKRKTHRERTLLSTLNDVRVSKVIDIPDEAAVKVYEKNPVKMSQQKASQPPSNGTHKNEAETDVKEKEQSPSGARNPNNFIEMGGRGDEILFGNDTGSIYSPAEARDVKDKIK